VDSRQLRRAFVDFFAARGHEVVPSAPLVPQNDPTLMFVNAGMVQFKDVFTGRERRPYRRACSSQKCIRISGKHNDLENVGVTARHHTFFEMLGNFSFGDYFKEEAIVYAWDLCVCELAIPPERLVVTVFAGEEDLPPDDEAAALWRKVSGLPAERIRRLGMADNFWSMGATGPCGPCSEIHFFHGDAPDAARFGEEPGVDGRGWTEIWNLVFMQYDRAEEGGPLTPLPAPCVDTGAGLERVAGVVEGVTSNYDTDLLRALVERTAAIAGKRYTAGAGDDDVSMRVVADHARTTAFLIAEGVLPERQKREYVLRRVMRRAIRHGHRLGIERPFLHEVALEVVRLMGDDYPELGERRELIARVTEGEEVRFRQTLRRGMKILDERFADLRARDARVLGAETAADLYTTYGFPLDLTEVICREQGFGVDADGARALIGGEGEAEGPIDPAAAVDAAHRELAARLPATRFVGYEREEGESEVLALVRLLEGGERPVRTLVEEAREGDAVEIVVAETPFYAESGGQVGDRGEIRAEGALVAVRDTVRPFGEITVHCGRLARGRLRVGARVALEVDHAARAATRRNHSATHLLHWALKVVLGGHAQQKGSLVGPDVLRFDFTHNAPLGGDEIARVEDLVNGKILENAPVTTDVLPIDEARQRGAVAIFEEKYGAVVRVLTMTRDSVELCGGTHCRALGDIGLFKITSESGTAAGVRRIFAATGMNALAHVRRLEGEMESARLAAKASGGDLADKIQKIVAQGRELERKVRELERKLVEGAGAGAGTGGGIDGMLRQARAAGEVSVLGVRAPDGTPIAALRELAEKLRDRLGAAGAGRAVVLAAAVTDGKAQLALMVSKTATERLKAGELIKAVARHVGGSGGGRPDMAQAGGTAIDGIDAALEAIHAEVGRALGVD
jgi:alanyl-tRNA synthetase